MKKKLLLIIAVFIMVCTPVYAEELEPVTDETPTPVVETVEESKEEEIPEVKEQPIVAETPTAEEPVLEEQPEPTVEESTTEDPIVESSKEEQKNLKGNQTPLDGATVTYEFTQIYTGEPIEPPVEVILEGETLVLNRDYTVRYENNIDSLGEEEPTIIIEGIGNYEGSIEKEFYITININLLEIESIPDQIYTGEPLNIELNVSFNGKKIENPWNLFRYEDYNNEEIGRGYFKLIGAQYGFHGNREIEFRILGNLAEYSEISLYNDYTYIGGKPVELSDYRVYFEDYGEYLTKDRDFTISYKNNINAGTATAIFTGKGYYFGTKSIDFEIAPADINPYTDIIIESAIFTGKPITPEITAVYFDETNEINLILQPNVDYDVVCDDPINAGDTYCTITGKGNYTGETMGSFTINEVSIEEVPGLVTVLPIEDQIYNGESITPEVVLMYNDYKLIKDKDYTVSYDAYTNEIGYAKIDISGMGNFNGFRETTFLIRGDINKYGELVPIDEGPIRVSYKNGQPVEIVYIRFIDSISGRLLSEGIDYDITYENNTNIGEATAIFNGKGMYYGSKPVAYNIVANIYDYVTVDPIPNVKYTGSAIEPDVNLYFKGNKLVENKDYTKTYSNNKNAGTGEVTITGMGLFEGFRDEVFHIDAIDLNELTYSEIPDQEYTGDYIRPEIPTTLNGKKLVENIDYTMRVEAKTLGLVTVTYLGKGNFTGSKDLTFNIKKNINNAEVTYDYVQKYTGEAIEPAVVVTQDGETLVLNRDYTVRYENNIYYDNGTPTIIIEGIGNYYGNIEKEFAIQVDINYLTIAPIEDQIYTGQDLDIDLDISFRGEKIINTNIVEIEEVNVTYIGKGIIILRGNPGYYGEREINFNIIGDINTYAEITIDEENVAYNNGNPVELVPLNVTICSGSCYDTNDYTISYINNINPGKATAIFTGKGYLYGTKEVYFNIIGDLEDAIIAPIEDQVYTGNEIKPELNITFAGNTLEKDKDYELTYRSNTNAGTAEITINPLGYYSTNNLLTVEFNILPASAEDIVVNPIPNQEYGEKLEIGDVTFNGKVLRKTYDYYVTYNNDNPPGIATANINMLTDNITGTKDITYTIVADINKVDFICSEHNGSDLVAEYLCERKEFEYTGNPITPAVKLSLIDYGDLVEGTDYTVTYANNINVGTATVTITGMGYYYGEKTISFSIYSTEPELIDLKDAVIAAIPNQVYTGNIIKPVLDVKYNGEQLTANKDYTVYYSNSAYVGTVTITIKGIGNYTGSKSTTYKIIPKAFGSLTFTSIPIQKYTGSAIKPNVTIKNGNQVLKINTDYNIVYKNNVNIGTATITVTGKGNYSGTKTLTFNIKYGIAYILNGGKNNAKNPAFHVGTTKITFAKPTRVGYTFKGWYKDAKFKKKITYIKKGSKANYTVYAKWAPIKYTIKYNKNGGKGTMTSSTGRKYDKSYTLKANKFKRKGYVFLGWTTKKDGTGVFYANKAVVKNLRNTKGVITLYAKWKKQ